MKKYVSWVLLICLSITQLIGYGIPIYAASASNDKVYPGYSKLNSNYSYKKLNYVTNQYENKTIDLHMVIDQLILLNTNLKNDKGMYVSPAVYAEYGLVVYENPGKYLTSRGYGDPTTITRTSVDGKSKTSNLEYRYLGYSSTGLKITNDLRLNDTGKVSAESLSGKKWVPIDTPLISWDRTDSNSSDYFDNIFLTPFISDDGTNTKNPGGINLAEVLNPSLTKSGVTSYPSAIKDADGRTTSGGAMALSQAQLKSIQAYTRLQVAPSLGVNGSVAIMHKLNGIAYYNTVILDSLTQDFNPLMTITAYTDASCTQAVTKVDVLPEETHKTIYVKVKTNLSMSNIGMVNRESDFISSITNSLSSKSLQKGTALTNFSDPSNMSTVFPVVLKRSDYKASYTKLPLKGEAEIQPKTDILKVERKISAEAFIQVRALDPNGLSPEFDIYEASNLVTDGTIVMSSTEVDRDYPLNLKDMSTATKDNSIQNWNWFIENSQTGKDDYFAWTQHASFTINAANASQYLNTDGTVTFKLVIKDQYGKLSEVSHNVTFAPSPNVPAVPDAHLDAPPEIKAGKVTYLSASASIQGGSISRYDIQVPSGVKIISGSETDKDVSFLSYGTDALTSLTVTADNGMTDSTTARTKVLHPLSPVMKTNGVYKINRTIELDSSESRGTTYYPIDQVTWIIKPMDGQSLGSIKPHSGSTPISGGLSVQGEKPKVDFKALGKYEVWMDVHSTCTYPGETWRTASSQVYGIIDIQPDQGPTALLSVPKMVIRDPNHYGRAFFTISSLSYSSDGDAIGQKRYYYRHDTDNDKTLADESWVLLKETEDDAILFESPLVGHYEFRLEVDETHDSVTSPFWNPETDILRANTDPQLLTEKTTEIQNVAPITSVLADRKSVDLIIATDYEGQELTALKADGDALAKDLLEQGVNLNIRYVSGRVKIGTSKLALNKYVRYGHLSYKVTDSTYPEDVKNHVKDQEWETKIQTENEYLPNYGLTVPTTFNYSTYQDNDAYHTDQGYKINVSAPSDPYLKNKTYSLQTLWGNAGGAGQWTYDTSFFGFVLDGFFKLVGVYSYSDSDLYGVDLDAVKQIPFRTGADRKLVFATKDSSGLLKLDGQFKEWAETNHVEVYTAGNNNVKDQVGYGKFTGAAFAAPDQVIATTELGQSYAIGKVNGNLTTDLVYPVKTAAKAATSPGLYFTSPYQSPDVVDVSKANAELCTTELGPPDEGRALFSGGIGHTDDNAGATDVSQHYQNVQYVYLGGNIVKKTFKDNSSTEVEKTETVLYKAKKYSVTYAMPTYSRLAVKGEDSGGKEKTLFATWTSQYEMMPTNLKKYEGSITYYGRVAVKRYLMTDSYFNKSPTRVCSLPLKKSSSSNPSSGMNSVNLYRNNDNDSYFLEKPSGSGSNFIWQLSDGGNGYGAYLWATDDYKFVSQNIGKLESPRAVNSQALYYLSPDKLSLKGIFNLYDSDAAVYPSSLRTETEPIRNMSIELGSNHFSPQAYLEVTESGKVLGYGSSVGGRFGEKPGSFVQWVPIAKESRSVVNNDPVTAYELISLSPKASALSNFTAFKETMAATYGSQSYSSSMTRLLGDTVSIQSVYGDYESDPLYDSAFNISHDSSGFENNQGIDENNGKTLANWDGSLSKVGLYTIKPRVQDSPNEDDRFSDYRLWNKDETALEILVHRRPVAKMRLALTSDHIDGTQVHLVAKDQGSLDLDHESQANKGLISAEWSIKTIGDSEWQVSGGAFGTSLSKTLVRGERYLLSYRVKDQEGEWSEPVNEEFVAGTQLLLEAKIRARDQGQQLNKMPAGGVLELYEVWSSYELSHLLEVQLFDGSVAKSDKMLIEKSGSTVQSEDFPEVNWKPIYFTLPKSGLSEKNYTLRLTAYDSQNPAVSKHKDFALGIVNNRPPVLVFSDYSPNELYEGDEHSVSLNVSDPDGDNLQLKVYMAYDGGSEVLYETFEGLSSGSTVAAKPLVLPNKRNIQWRGVLSDGNALSMANLNLDIKAFGIESLSLQGAWHHWRGQINGFGIQMSNEPYRFLSYESVSFTVETRGEPDRVLLRLSPALEAMSFKDERGKVYRYKDEIGYEIEFPIIFKPLNVNKYNLKYVLPLARSTIGWNNQRNLPPYQIEIGIEKAGRLHWTIFGDEPGEPKIDLTGNIFDLQFNQPKAK